MTLALATKGILCRGRALGWSLVSNGYLCVRPALGGLFVQPSPLPPPKKTVVFNKEPDLFVPIAPVVFNKESQLLIAKDPVVFDKTPNIGNPRKPLLINPFAGGKSPLPFTPKGQGAVELGFRTAPVYNKVGLEVQEEKVFLSNREENIVLSGHTGSITTVSGTVLYNHNF